VDETDRPDRRARRGVVAVVAAAVAVTAVLAGITAPGTAAAPSAPAASAALRLDAQGTTPSTTAAPGARSQGRLAYVTAAGEVVVADGDGTDARPVGRDAATNAVGLAPLAWRQPGAESIAYVRTDGSLVVARVDGGGELVVATDAAVPSYADEQLLSWDVTGTFLSYLGEVAPGTFESRVVDFSQSEETSNWQVRTVGNPDKRIVLAQAFSPIDPIMWQRTVDPETSREFTLALVEPVGGGIVGVPFGLGDPSISPDGRVLYGVVRDAAGVSQLVRIRISKPRIEPIFDNPSVCKPMASPDATKVVFGAGDRCEEVWVIDADGDNPRRISRQLGADADFRQGVFSWSRDGRTVSHAACTAEGDLTRCGGGYWDIDVDGRSARRGAVAGSVVREQRPLIRPVKVRIEVDGPVRYSGRLRVGAQSVGQLVGRSQSQLIEATARDDDDPSRRFVVKLTTGPGSSFVAGTLRIVDGDFDESFTFMGRAALASYGYARVRGVWMRTGQIPFQSGQLVLTLER